MIDSDSLLKNDGASISTVLRHGMSFDDATDKLHFTTYPSSVNTHIAARYAVSSSTLFVVAYQENNTKNLALRPLQPVP